ncbi:hypothetical protein SAMN02745116_00422 [Pilibacter termitis]|uniref:Uncharacterized protein n=1 Tax=Pilibacter termitis TaxID=263852 RepID=A0A1T4KVW4_9ENTE|nr:hypothetical protein [Pilibacter termitis]SJZ46584.1 hypothetical protein SAMN02745116_00422 [Pilibacter termitis]
MTTKNFLQTTKGKSIVGGVVVLALVGGAIAIKAQTDYAQTEKVKTTLKQEIKETKTLFSKARALLDEKQEFLKKDLKKEEIDKVKEELQKNEKEVKSFDDQKYKELFSEFSSTDKEVSIFVENVEKMFQTQTEVNDLFTVKVLNGSEVGKEIILKKDVKNESIVSLEKQLLTKEKDTAFKAKVRDVVIQARVQFTDIENARKATVESEKDKGNREKNKKALELVAKIKNTDVKKELEGKLNPIKAELDKKDKEAEEKRKEEEKKGAEVAQNEQQAQEQANQSGQPVYNENTGEYVQPTAQANSGGGASTNNSGGSQGGGQAQSPSTSAPSQPQPQQPAAPAPQPSKPQTPNKPPAGWYDTNGQDPWEWMDANGFEDYSGFNQDPATGWINPYK